MDQDGYRSEEPFNSPSNSDNDKELLAPDTSGGESEADDVDVNMTHLFYLIESQAVHAAASLLIEQY